MIKWFKRSKKDPLLEEKNAPLDNPLESPPTSNPAPVEGLSETIEDSEVAVIEVPEPVQKKSFFSRLKSSLSKTRHKFGQNLGQLLAGKKTLDKALEEELETSLLAADVGVSTTSALLHDLKQALAKNKLSDSLNLYDALKEELANLLLNNEKALACEETKPFVILVVGVNGVGKTTSIAKIAQQFQKNGKRVMLAAADTFRAAAVEQLKVWGDRHHIPVIAQHTGADAASVSYDAFQAAKARQTDILLIDTAGRLHTQAHLMEELKKIKRVLQKLDPKAPHETMLILDASLGQNALVQARQFHEALGLDSISMTKLDGTAKGGILFAIAHELKLPFRYLGVGEGIDDLRPFEAKAFINAIFHDDSV